MREIHRMLRALVLCGTLAVASADALSSSLKRLDFDYTPEQIRCAACESVSQALEQQMSSGSHLGKHAHKRSKKKSTTDTSSGDGAVERSVMLSEVCDHMDGFVPDKLEDTKTMHFLKRSPGAGNQMGLRDYCEELVESHESDILETIREAKPVDLPPSLVAMSKNKGVLHYEVKSALCVAATARCTEERLLAISNGRILSAKGNPAVKEMMAEYAKHSAQTQIKEEM